MIRLDCNARLKLEKDFDVDTHFNPYEKRLHDHFRFKIDKLNPAGHSDFNIQISSATAHSPLAIDDFRILERYNQNHKSLLYDTIAFMRHRRKGIFNSILRQLPNLFTDFQEADRMAKIGTGIPITTADINTKQLAKLKLDVCDQLGIL